MSANRSSPQEKLNYVYNGHNVKFKTYQKHVHILKIK